MWGAVYHFAWLGIGGHDCRSLEGVGRRKLMYRQIRRVDPAPPGRKAAHGRRLHPRAARDPPHPAHPARQALRPRRGQGRRTGRPGVRPGPVAAARQGDGAPGDRGPRGVRRGRLRARRARPRLRGDRPRPPAVPAPRHRRPRRPLLLALGTEPQKRAYLPRLARGELTATLAVPGAALALALGLTGDNADGAWAGGGRAGGIQARQVDGEWRLYGEAAQVLDGHRADLLLVAAHTGGFTRSRVRLFLVRGDADGLRRTRQTTLDETRAQGRVQLREVGGELVGDGDPTAALAATGRTAAATLAAEAVGAGAHVLERTVAYVKEREQFGRPIGSFQAVKHRLADRYVQVQAARSAAYYAAWDPDAGGLALAQAMEALRSAAAEAIQLHGGIGFTWEHEAHLYFKRAASDELLFGPVPLLRAWAAEGAGLFRSRTSGTRAQAVTR